MSKCSNHPDAPHGFNRSASHAEGRYVCDCEGWIPDDGENTMTKQLGDRVFEHLLDTINFNGAAKTHVEMVDGLYSRPSVVVKDIFGAEEKECPCCKAVRDFYKEKQQ